MRSREVPGLHEQSVESKSRQRHHIVRTADRDVLGESEGGRQPQREGPDCSRDHEPAKTSLAQVCSTRTLVKNLPTEAVAVCPGLPCGASTTML